MCRFIGQSDIKHIMTSLIKAITSVLKTDIISARPIRLTEIKVITSVLKALTDIISARPIRLAEIKVIMSVSTFKIAVILYIISTLDLPSIILYGFHC